MGLSLPTFKKDGLNQMFFTETLNKFQDLPNFSMTCSVPSFLGELGWAMAVPESEL